MGSEMGVAGGVLLPAHPKDGAGPRKKMRVK